MRKRNHRMKPRPMEVPCPVRAVIGSRQPITAAEAQQLVDETRAALRSLLAGTASDKEFSRVAVDVNIGYALASRGRGGDITGDLFARAGHALNEADRMRREHGRYGLGDAAHRISLCEAIDLWEEILRESSPLQVQQAEEAVIAAAKAGRQRQPAHSG